MAPPPPALPEELVESILLRIPPDEPACLFRASLVCKPWCRLISGPGFRCRYRQFHRSPPLLGFLCGILGSEVETARFVPTSPFCSPPADLRNCRAVDVHHGRVLLRRRCRGKSSSENVFVVWDPISDERRELPIPIRWQLFSRKEWNAAVFCAAAGPCDHLDCRRGPFAIVFVETDFDGKLSFSTYSSDTGTWSDRIFLHQPVPSSTVVGSAHCAHVGNTLYFRLNTPTTALKYDLCSREMSAIQLPPTSNSWWPHVFTSTDNGDLGCVTVNKFKLCMWSQVDAAWTQNRVIDLEMLLRSNDIMISPHLVGFVNGINVFVLRAKDVIFTVDLKTKNLKVVSKGKIMYNVFLYMTFYTPALGAACSGEGSNTVGSDA